MTETFQKQDFEFPEIIGGGGYPSDPVFLPEEPEPTVDWIVVYGWSYAAGSNLYNRNRVIISRGRTYNVGVFASVVVNSNTVGNTKAVSAGTFATNTVKPISAKVTNKLAGVANNAILKGADPVTRSIHKIESVVTHKTATAFRAGFNLFTGQYSSSVSTATDSFGSDNASSPTNGVRGRVTYQTGRSKSV